MVGYIDIDSITKCSMHCTENWCRCPNCGHVSVNPQHLPCIYFKCPLCETPMLGTVT